MICPLQDYLLVELDPFPEHKGNIVLLADSTASVVRTGTVLKVGPGRFLGDTSKRKRVDVEPGEKVAFLRWHLEHQMGKQVTRMLAELGGNKGLIRCADVLFAFHASENIEVTQ